MARTDADALKTQIAGGPVTATVTVDVTVTTQENGGHGYNALAMIPGSKYPDQIIVVSGHHDAHFGGAIDNTTAVVLQLAMAKAITLSGYKPERTLLFLSTTAEEAGAFNSYWNWMYGSWYLLTKTHMDWPGRVVADINWEFPGLTGVTKASVNANQELIPWLTTFNAAAPADYAPPTSINPTVGVWADSGNFWALGIPVIYLYSSSGSYSFNNYHTQSDDMTLIDWTLLNKNVKLTAAYARGLDTGGSVVTGLLPYSLKARADNLALAANSDPAALLAAGADSAAVTRFSTDIAALQAAGNTYESTKSIIRMSQIGQVNSALLQTIKVLNEPLYGFTSALGAGYNHAIIRTDLLYLGWAIATLQADPTDPTGWGYTYLSWINWQWYNQFFDHASTAEYLALQMPDYERLYAATLFHPATPLDLWTQMDQVKDHNGAAALPALLAAQAQDVAALNASLNRESTAIEQALVIWNDHTAPVTTAAGNDSLWHRSGQKLWITLAAADNSGGSGVASSEYSIDSAGGPWTTYDYAVMLAPGAFADGPHTFYYRSRDVSGNVETAQSFTFKIDKKGPQTFNVGLYTKSVKRNHTATLRYRVTDSWSSKVTVRIQVVNRLGHTVAVWKVGKVATGWALSYKHRVTLARGTYTCRFKATDQAGNAQSRTGTMHLVVF
jgi:hypothetical protein